MKIRIIIMALFIMAIIAESAFGTVWKVNNNEGVVTDFTTLQEAHDDENVQPGDFLYVYGSPTAYGGLALTKKLNIIGPGYLLDDL